MTETSATAAKRGPYAKSAETRQAILEAAFRVFAENGYRGASMRAITEQIGVTQPLIFHYFRNKGALLTAVLELRDERGLDVSPLDVSQPVDSIRKLVDLMRYNEAHPGIVALHCAIAGEAITPGHPAHESFRTRYAFVVERLTRILEGCRDEGRLTPGIEPKHAARNIVAMMDGLQTQWMLDPEENLADEFEAYLRTVVDF